MPLRSSGASITNSLSTTSATRNIMTRSRLMALYPVETAKSDSAKMAHSWPSQPSVEIRKTYSRSFNLNAEERSLAAKHDKRYTGPSAWAMRGSPGPLLHKFLPSQGKDPLINRVFANQSNASLTYDTKGKEHDIDFRTNSTSPPVHSRNSC
jgi:hypothetical protein